MREGRSAEKAVPPSKANASAAAGVVFFIFDDP
jgi:hypothetical protein